jgi:hypothetical protein
VERALRGDHLLETSRSLTNGASSSSSSNDGLFLVDADAPPDAVGKTLGVVTDDHVPFLQRGVAVVHLVPTPFPWDLWHRPEDDGDHLDLAAVVDWARILAGWVGGWMELEGFIEEGETAGGEKDEL